jgi:hypothetical protein
MNDVSHFHVIAYGFDGSVMATAVGYDDQSFHRMRGRCGKCGQWPKHINNAVMVIDDLIVCESCCGLDTEIYDTMMSKAADLAVGLDYLTAPENDYADATGDNTPVSYDWLFEGG